MPNHLERKLKRIKSQLSRAGVPMLSPPSLSNTLVLDLAQRHSKVISNGKTLSGIRGHGFNICIEDGYVHFRVWPVLGKPPEYYSSVTAGTKRIKELFGQETRG